MAADRIESIGIAGTTRRRRTAIRNETAEPQLLRAVQIFVGFGRPRGIAAPPKCEQRLPPMPCDPSSVA